MFRMSFIFAILTIAAFFLSSCATLTKHECEKGDWHGIGKRDGEHGHDVGRFQDHQNACKGHGLIANFTAYKQGRLSGLKSYCDIQRQLDLGLDGQKYNGACSGSIVPLLKEANDWGYRGYNVKMSLYEAQNQLTEIRKKMQEEKVTKQEKQRFYDQETRLQEEIDRLRLELVRMKIEAEKVLSQRAKVYYKTN